MYAFNGCTSGVSSPAVAKLKNYSDPPCITLTCFECLCNQILVCWCWGTNNYACHTRGKRKKWLKFNIMENCKIERVSCMLYIILQAS